MLASLLSSLHVPHKSANFMHTIIHTLHVQGDHEIADVLDAQELTSSYRCDTYNRSHACRNGVDYFSDSRMAVASGF